MGDVLATPLCRRLGIEVPVVQAPIGSAARPELAAAVSAAGGLGMLALTWWPPDEARRRIEAVRRATDRPFGVNLVLDFPVADVLAACLDARVPVVSSFWGDPAQVSERVRAAGAVHLHTVGSVEEARRAVDAGVDVVVAQGCEAGGHVRGEVSTLALVPAVVDAVAPVPVVAAGGIADGRGLAAVLALGAQAGWLGTRFLAAAEAFVHDAYRRRVVAAAGQDAVLTTCFDLGWPAARHRVLRNATLAEWERTGSPPAPDRPGEGTTVVTDADGNALPRYVFAMPTPDMTGDVEELPLYAGQSVGLVRDVQPAARIVRALADEAAKVLAGLRGGG